MAVPYEWFRTRRLYRGDVRSYVIEGINWQLFLMMFEVAYSRYMVSLRTPWFQIRLSSGEREWNTLGRWYGVRLYWGHPKGWNLSEGGWIFTRGDSFLSFAKPEMQREF